MISIIIPCSEDYKKRFLPECLDSIISQPFNETEVIVQEYFPEEKNMAQRLNEAIDKVKSEWILMLGADDKLDPKCLQRLVELSKKGEADVYYGDIIEFGALNNHFKPKETFTYEDILENNQIAITSMFRKSKWLEVGKYTDVRGEYPEDWELWARMKKFGAKFQYVGFPILYYRVHKEQAWTTMKNNIKEYRERIKERLDNIK